LLTRFKNKYESIFLDPQSERFHTDERVNIILSPSLYWVKKVSLPIKYVREVKKLLPSLFEDTLPHGNYNYSAYKSGDDFFIFAYEDKQILETLLQKGISASNVADVYFAQSELSHIQNAIEINRSQSIYVKDEILLLVPSSWVKERGDLDLSQIKLSNHSITLQQFGHIVDTKSLYKIGAVVLLFTLLLATEYFITAYKLTQIIEQKEELFAKYSLKSTMLENKSMLKKYDSTYMKQIKLRDTIAYILALRLNPSEELSQLNFKNTILEAEFSGITEGKEQHITEIFKSKNVNFKASFKDKSWHVEISI
jgi:hypothetical protein